MDQRYYHPFTVQIAQKIAEVPIGSGLGLRLLVFVVLSGLGYIYLMRYGKRVKRNRKLSVMPDDTFLLPDDGQDENLKLEKLPKYLAAEGMFVFQSFLNFFIPSASGQALVSMPLMTPLADLLDVSRQTAVLAFTLGDGLSNMIVPTSGFLMAILGLAEIPYEKWARFMLPLFLITSLAAIIIIGVAVAIGY